MKNKNISQLLISMLFAIPSTVIIGWIYNEAIITWISPGSTSMNPMTAITFLLAAFACVLINNFKENKKFSGIIISLCLSVIGIGLLRLGGYLYIFDVEINHFLFTKKRSSDITVIPSRMAPNTAFAFIISGIVLLHLHIKRRQAAFADLLAITVFLIGLFCVIGYLYDAREFYAIKGFVPMALPTAICFIILSLTIFSHKKNKGFTKEISSPYGGRRISVILIPLALVLSVVLGYLILLNEKYRFASTSLTVASMVITNIIILIFFIWKIASSINLSNRRLIKQMKARKRIEVKLKESNIFLDIIFENMPAILFVKEAKALKYVRINKATEEFLNLKKGEVIGKTDEEIFLADTLAFIRQMDIEVLTEDNKEVFTKEEKIEIDNQIRWVSIKKIPFESNDGSKYILGIAQEISEQKRQQEQIQQFNKELEEKVLERTEQLRKSENRFRSLIENGVDAIKMMSPVGFIYYASCSYKRVLGFAPQEIIHTNWFAYLHPDEKNAAIHLIHKSLLQPLVPHEGFFRLLHKKGHYIHAEVTITNFLNDESVSALVCNFHDVTERIEIENEKQRLQKALAEEKLNRQKQITLATMDAAEKERIVIGMELHDNINQLLGVIKLYIGLAIKTPSNKKELLDKSYENVQLCISEIKKLSKSLVVPNFEIGASKAIENLVENIEKGTELNFNYHVTDHVLTKINQRKQMAFYRITQELLNNIVKHAEAKNVIILFTEDGVNIVLNVKDDGKGFDTTAVQDGIGLRNIQNRTEVLNGVFEIKSNPDEGTSVCAAIPKD